MQKPCDGSKDGEIPENYQHFRHKDCPESVHATGLVEDVRRLRMELIRLGGSSPTVRQHPATECAQEMDYIMTIYM